MPDGCLRPSFSRKFWSGIFPSFTLVPVKSAVELVETGSIQEEIYLSAIDLAHVLKVTDAEIPKLARSGVLVRIPRPDDARAFLYPLLENTTRYVTPPAQCPGEGSRQLSRGEEPAAEDSAGQGGATACDGDWGVDREGEGLRNSGCLHSGLQTSVAQQG